MNKVIFLEILIYSLIGSYAFGQCDDYQNYMQEVVDNADDAEEYAEEAYNYARKAYYADNLDDAQYYAKKAMDATVEAQDEADNAEYEGNNGLYACD